MQKQQQSDSEKLLELKKAQNAAEVNREREIATAQGQIEKAKQNQVVKKEQTQQEVEEAIVRLKVAEQQALQAQEEAKGISLAELVEKRNRAEAVKVREGP